MHTTNYVLHLRGEHNPSFACRRIEFDHYLFEKAKEAGAEAVQARVTELDFAEDGVMVFGESNNIKTDAAEIIVKNEYSKESSCDYLENCRDLIDDIPCGKVLRFATNLSSRLVFLDSICKSAQNEALVRKALFNIVSGQETYKNTWRETRSLRLFLKLGFNAIASKFKRN